MSCDSSFTDPTKRRRQRNLQHSVTFLSLSGPNETTVNLISGQYAASGFKVHLERKQYQLVFQVYLPCVLFVAVSWVSFLIKPEVVPGRMALLVTLFLVLVNIFNTARYDVPSHWNRTCPKSQPHSFLKISGSHSNWKHPQCDRHLPCHLNCDGLLGPGGVRRHPRRHARMSSFIICAKLTDWLRPRMYMCSSGTPLR